MPAAVRTDDHVVLVDERDRTLGACDKFRAHREALLHRAVSVLLFDGPRLILQQRANGKYHSPGLWSNTCCGHPRLGEAPHHAARRRLREELNVRAALRRVLVFQYRAQVAPDLAENEVDHVFVGEYSGRIDAAADEVQAIRRMSLADLEGVDRSGFTQWLFLILDACRTQGVKLPA